MVVIDAALGGEWAYCKACKFAGDMITLSSCAWKLDIHTTLTRLIEQGVLVIPGHKKDPHHSYINNYYDPLLRLRTLWKECQNKHIHPETAGMRMLQRRLGVDDVSADWNERAGQFIGSANKVLIESVIQHGKYKNWVENRHKFKCGFQTNIFHGRKWKELLVVPFWDMPGRMSAFMIIGREADKTNDYMYKSLIQEVSDGGVAMLPAIMNGKHQYFDNKKFILLDLDIAVRLHARYSKEHSQPLPLAVAYDDGRYVTRDIWKLFNGSNLIFWGTDLVKTIKQAKLAKGLVSVMPLTDVQLSNQLRHLDPQQLLRRMEAAAVPWAIALQDYMDNSGDDLVEDVLTQLDLHGRDLALFIEGCCQSLRNRLRGITENKKFDTQLRFESHWIHQRTDGLYLAKTDECISNALVRVEQIITTLDDKNRYRGIIRFNEKEYPFTERTNVLEKGLLSWVQAYLRDKCHAGISEYYPNWNRKALQISLKLHPPQYVRGISMVGWDADSRQFNFPNFVIRHNGEVLTDFAFLFESSEIPGQHLPPPGMIPREYIKNLGDANPETQIFWATAAGVISNIIAPAIGRKPKTLLLAGDGAHGVGSSAAIRLGCAAVLDYKKATYFPDQLPTFEWANCWPAVVPLMLAHNKYRWLEQQQAPNFVLSVPAVAGSVLAMRGRVNMIRYHRQLGSLQLLYDAAPFVIPNYIQDLYTRNIFMPDASRDLADDVLQDLAAWFERTGGNAETVLSARDVLRTPTARTPVDYFCELVFELFTEGKLKIGRDGYDKADERCAIMQFDSPQAGMWISQSRFSKVVERAGGVAPDLLLITRSLKEQHLLLDEPLYAREHGWLVPEQWWNSRFQTWRQDAACPV